MPLALHEASFGLACLCGKLRRLPPSPMAESNSNSIPGGAEPPPDRTAPDTTTLEGTADLLDRARNGDGAAREALIARYLPALRRLAHGRVPARSRSVFDTDDLVQTAVVRALRHLDSFEPRHHGSLLCYLRQIVINRVRDQFRHVSRTPEGTEAEEDLVDPTAGPLERTIGADMLARYEQALAGLRPEQQEALTLRLEMGSSYAEIAEALGRQTAQAARMLTGRALLQLVERMRELGVTG